MAELYENWVVRKLTAQEKRELSDEEKQERRRLKKRIDTAKHSEKNTGKRAEYSRKYYEEHKEERKEYKRQYNQSPAGKKLRTINEWVTKLGLQESDEDLDRIYELRETQELCNACDVKLTRNGDRSSTDASMDHDHETHRFRHIICNGCNVQDKWKQYFC